MEILWRTLIADQAQDQYPAPSMIAVAFREFILQITELAVQQPVKKV